MSVAWRTEEEKRAAKKTAKSATQNLVGGAVYKDVSKGNKGSDHARDWRNW